MQKQENCSYYFNRLVVFSFRYKQHFERVSRRVPTSEVLKSLDVTVEFPWLRKTMARVSYKYERRIQKTWRCELKRNLHKFVATATETWSLIRIRLVLLQQVGRANFKDCGGEASRKLRNEAYVAKYLKINMEMSMAYLRFNVIICKRDWRDHEKYLSR
jgi:hypothetical protein